MTHPFPMTYTFSCHGCKNISNYVMSSVQLARIFNTKQKHLAVERQKSRLTRSIPSFFHPRKLKTLCTGVCISFIYLHPQFVLLIVYSQISSQIQTHFRYCTYAFDNNTLNMFYKQCKYKKRTNWQFFYPPIGCLSSFPCNNK